MATVLGGTLAAGGANAINMYVDRDIDAVMNRTQQRPLVTGVVQPTEALVFAIGIEILAFFWLWTTVNLISAVLAVSACLFYVFVYTLWLKRTSSRNIVIGGAAGAVPVLIGWTSVVGHLDWAPIVLFARHRLLDAAALLGAGHQLPRRLRLGRRADAAVGGQPAHHGRADPPVHPRRSTRSRWCSRRWRTWAASTWPARVVLGAIFTAMSVTLLRTESTRSAMRLFGYSITYITLLFGSMVVDQLVRLPR